MIIIINMTISIKFCQALLMSYVYIKSHHEIH